jgi:hypothetical protein
MRAAMANRPYSRRVAILSPPLIDAHDEHRECRREREVSRHERDRVSFGCAVEQLTTIRPLPLNGVAQTGSRAGGASIEWAGYVSANQSIEPGHN